MAQYLTTNHGTETLPRAARDLLRSELTHVQPQPLLDPIQSVSRETISWRRKIFHILGIGCVGITYGLSSATPGQAFLILGLIALAFCSMDLLRFYVPALNKRIRRDFGAYMRNYELKRLTGSSWFFFGALITIALFSREAAAVGFVCLAIGDPLASWVGVRWGRIRLPGGKSLEGSLTLFASCFVVSILLMLAMGTLGSSLGAIALLALCAAAAAAVAEWLPLGKVDDNFVVPLLTAATLSASMALF